MAAAADYNSYLECSASSSSSSSAVVSGGCFRKSSSSSVYDSCGGRSSSESSRHNRSNSRNMGVLVTGPWPMSHEPVYDRPSSGGGGGGVSIPLGSSCSRRSLRERKEQCCHHTRHHSDHNLGHNNNGHHNLAHHHHLVHHQSASVVRHIHNNNNASGSSSVSEVVSLRNPRPFSVPPSTEFVRLSNGSLDRNQMEMIPLNGHSLRAGVPSRATLNEFHSTASPPTCVPWLRKMKVIKKLQRKIGIGNRGGGISPNNLPPLLFNSVHGENITLSQNQSVAKRTHSFCKGIVFSDRAVKINEKVCLKFIEVEAKNWSGVLRFGFTSHDPSSLRNGLPKYACPDLTSRPGFWAKAFSELYVKKDAILYFYVNAAGDVYFGINGEEKGLFFSGVDTRGPLWVLIDIYGNTTGLEFVDPRSQLNNSRSNVCEIPATTQIPSSSSIPAEPAQTQLVAPAVVQRSTATDTNKLYSAAILKAHALFPNIQTDVDQFNPLTKGPHAIVSGSIARRLEGEYSNAYVFPNKPLLPGETVVIYIQKVDLAYASSMAFGVTSCSPKDISHVGFPVDADELMDRRSPEYWVVVKDVAKSPSQGDILGFTITPDGQVVMRKNDEVPKILMHVDNSVPLYPFFDLYGTTTQIHLVGIVPSMYYRPLPPLPSQSGRCRTELPRSSSMQASSPYTALIRNNVPHSISAVNCAPSKVGASSSQQSAAALAAMSSNEKNTVTYETLTKKVGGLNLGSSSPPSRDPPNWSIECVACCERPVDSVFYSCGHMCMCYQCAVEYWKTKEKGCCPICRATINDVIRTYKS